LRFAAAQSPELLRREVAAQDFHLDRHVALLLLLAHVRVAERSNSHLLAVRLPYCSCARAGLALVVGEQPVLVLRVPFCDPVAL